MPTTNESHVPSFRVEFGWDRINPTRLQIGVFNRALPQPIFTSVPIETTRKECYTHARTFCTWVNNILKPGWECYFDQQRLYSDWNGCHHRHMYLIQPREEVASNLNKAAELADLPLEKASALLHNLHPDIHSKVEKGGSFYIQSTRYVYICNPVTRRLWVLLPEGPKSLCVYITDSAVQRNKYDWMIAMYRYLMASEQGFLKTANHFDFYLSEREEVQVAQTARQEES